MTLPFLGTARYNAQPLARHIAQDQPQPVYTSLDALIADMKASAEETAREERKRQISDGRYAKKTRLDNDDIIAFIAKNPGATTVSIAKQFDEKVNIIYARMKTIAKSGAVKVKWVPGESKKVQSFFATGKEGKSFTEKQTPVLDSMIEYIRQNPGSSTTQIAEALGRTRPSVVACLRRARAIVNIETKKERVGSHNAARHWVTE